MSEKSNKKTHLLLFGATGWLFADLLLALAMLFLVATSVGHVAAPPTPTPRPTATATPLPVVILNRCPIEINLTVNSALISSDDPTAVGHAEQALRGVAQLKGERAGLVFVYAGTLGVGRDGAVTNANNLTNNVLKPLGKQGFVFGDAVYHDPLLNLNVDPNLVVLEIYVFAQTAPGAPPPTTNCANSPTIPVNGA